MNTIGTIIHQRRHELKLTLQRLSSLSGVSTSLIARIERSERFPSTKTLRKLAKPLGFTETELFALAGYLPNPAEQEPGIATGLDPYVASVLARVPVPMQRAVLDILGLIQRLKADGTVENK